MHTAETKSLSCLQALFKSRVLKPIPSPQLLRTRWKSSTVDQSEIRHFDALASTWWDPHGSSRLLHLMNPYRHAFIASCQSSVLPKTQRDKLRYLDVGCGGGIFAESAARLSNTATVIAIDPSLELLRIAEQHRRRDPALSGPRRTALTYLNVAIEDLPVADKVEDRFDIVSVFEVLEHVTYPAPFLEHAMAHVRPGGWLVLSTIARTATSWLVTKLLAEYLLHFISVGTHDWSKFINITELREWFGKKEGWGDSRSMGIAYLPGFGWRTFEGAKTVIEK